jgi:hypothetical protein
MVTIQKSPIDMGLLSADEVFLLGDWVTKLLVGLITSRVESDHLCRLCDEDTCGANCPVELEACRSERGAIDSVP